MCELRLVKINLNTVNLGCHGSIVDKEGCLQLRTERKLLKKVRPATPIRPFGPVREVRRETLQR